MAHSEAYVRVDTAKILDAADALDAIIKEMDAELDAMKRELASLDGNAFWRGTAYERWRTYCEKRYAKVAADVEKYQQFSAFMRERVQVYLLHAAQAQALADNLDSEVTRLVSDLLQQSGASLREIRDAAKAHNNG